MHTRQNCDIVWAGLFICSVIMSDHVVYWVFTAIRWRHFGDAFLGKKKKRDVNGQVFEYNVTCYDDGIHGSILFVSCVMFNCKALLIYNIECIFWSVIRPGFFSVWTFFKLDFPNRWRASHFDPERITYLEERTIFPLFFFRQVRENTFPETGVTTQTGQRQR